MRRSHCVRILLAVVMLLGSTAWAENTIDLTEDWRFAPDPGDIGLAEGWHRPEFDDSGWAVIDAGKRWEDQGYPDVDGYAWYRKRVFIPEDMRAPCIWLNLGGLNDCGTVYCNGQQVGVFGDKHTISVAAKPIAAVLTDAIRWGADNLIAIRVYDWEISGGPQYAPVNLTTDPEALAVQSSLCLAPGDAGRPFIAGLDVTFLGVPEGTRVRFSAQVDGAQALVKEARAVADRDGNPIAAAAFDLQVKPGASVTVSGGLADTDSVRGGDMVFTKTYVCPPSPRWPGRYRKLKVLNNFVTELKVVKRVWGKNRRYTFLNPREGWVFLRVTGAEEPLVYGGDEPSPLVWRKHPETGALEAMRYLPEGKHRIRVVNAKGARVDIRAVPELAFCYWPTRAVLSALPPRDRAFAERHVFPNVNTLLTHNKMEPALYDSWRAEGRHWISNSSLPGLHDDTAPTADFVYEEWAANACVTRPGYSGLIVDEFLSSPADYYTAWTEAVERLYDTPGFAGQTFYAWVVNTYAHEPGLEFMRGLYDLGGRFAWERYLHEQPTEELALLSIYSQIAANLDEWNDAMPGVAQRTTVCLGSFTTPWCSLNINPGVNYIPFMDTQFRVLATDPAFFNMLGVFQWAAHYTDDDVLRYAMKLYRHYGIEGALTPYGDEPYLLTHIANPDFANGLNGWRVEPAKVGSIAAAERFGLGKIQGRWTDPPCGDQCAVMVRSDAGPNVLSQTAKDLEPGRLYSLKFIAADLDDLEAAQEVGLWPTIEGADLANERSFRQVMPSSYALDFEGFNRKNRAYTTYCQVLFRPRGTTVELTFSDWRDGEPAGPIGQRLGFNFVEIQPFFEE